jgi:hypothetical protein
MIKCRATACSTVVIKILARHLYSQRCMDADKLVRIWQRQPGDSYYAVLGGGDLPEVKIGPEANPANAKATAKQLEAFINALLSRAGSGNSAA